jgi:hypothetical protein
MMKTLLFIGNVQMTDIPVESKNSNIDIIKTTYYPITKVTRVKYR